VSRRSLWAGIGLLVAAGVAVLVLSLSSSGPSTPAGYGVAVAGANLGVSKPVATCRVRRVPCPAGELALVSPFGGGSPASPAFDAFRRQVLLSAGRTGYMRLWIAYDALYAWNPASQRCGSSPYAFGPPASFNGVNGSELFAQLVWNVQGARSLGLTPEVVFSAGSGEGGVPHYPAPGYGDGTALSAGVTTAGYDYYCGVLGVMSSLRADLGKDAPNHWEAFNEPDTKSSYMGDLKDGCAVNSSCGVEPLGSDYNYGSYLCGRPDPDCGPLEAAELWELAEGAVTQERWSGQQVAALTQTDPEGPYVVPYVQQLNALSSCAAGFVPAGAARCPSYGVFPRYWAVHDYDDPTAGGTADLRAFELTLARAARGHGPLQVWVTESGVELNSSTPADLNRHGCPSPSGGANLGACVNDNPAAQARGARAWRSLLYVSAPGVRTTSVYWFEFQLIPSWDSALVDADGRPLDSFCALVSGARCDGNASASLSAR
jgi:hypothetical protein